MASTYISRTLASNGQKKGTISVWFKIAGIGTERAIVTSYYDATYHASILLSSNDQIDVFDYRSGYVSRLLTTRLFRDVGAWYHLVYEFDSTNGVADDRNKLWINGVQETAFDSRTNYGSSASTSWDTDYSFRIGARNSDQYWNGNMSYFYFIQGYNYSASTFGETDSTSGIWKIKTNASVDYDGTGGNSCFLKMEDRTNLDLDSGDNSLTMTTTGNLTATYDNPSNNFSTWNSLNFSGNASYGMAYSNGNTTISPSSPDANGSRPWTASSLGMPASGKWYAEFKLIANDEVTQIGIGSANIVANRLYYNNAYGDTTECLIWEPYLGKIIYNGSYLTEGLTAAVGNDILGIAVDCANEKMYCYINGSLINSGGESYTSKVTGSQILYLVGDNTTGGYDSVQANFGNGYFGTTAVSTSESDDAGIGSFEYDVPAGYYALCTTNLGDQS